MGWIRRARVRAAGVVVVALVVAAAGAVVPGGAAGTATASTDGPTRYATASITSVRTSSTGTSAATMNTRTAAITGLGDLFDVLRTERLPDGRWLSFTGDANAEVGQPWPVYDNAAVIWDSAGQRRVSSPHPGGHFFPRWPDGSEFWPYQFVLSGGRAYVLGERVISYSGAGNWTKLGAYGSVVDVPASGDPRFLHYFPTPGSMLDDSAVQWNGAIAADGDWLYLHGVRDRADAYHSRDGGYVARVALDRLEVPHRWQVWTGTGWADRVYEAVPTIPIWADTTDGTSSSYTLHRRPTGDWQVTTKRGGDIGQTLGRYTGPTPWGPWTWEPLLQVCSLDCYLAGAAPSIPTASGRLLVQWSRTDKTPVWAEVPQ